MALHTNLLVGSILLVIIVALVLILSLRIHSKRTKRLQSLLTQWQHSGEYLNNLEAFTDGVSSVTKDVQNMIENIQHPSFSGVFPAKNNETYLIDCDNLLAQFYTGNEIIDALFYSKALDCKSLGINLIIEINAFPVKALPEIDITAIVGNLMDNAKEAAKLSKEVKPTIHLLSEIKQSVWLLRIETSKDPATTITPENMETTKLDKENHGLGIQILRSLTEQYNGSIKFKDLGNRFQVTILIIL